MILEKMTFLTRKLISIPRLGVRVFTRILSLQLHPKAQNQLKLPVHSPLRQLSSLGATSFKLKSTNSSKVFPTHSLTFLLCLLCQLCLTIKHTR